MKISYLGNNSWKTITREERYFTAMLFSELSKNLNPFLKLLANNGIGVDPDDDKNYEPAYEVCFYRDILKHYHSPIKGNFSPKRTFDLVLFSNDQIIIIEAKANQSFTTEQLESFKKDREDLKILFGNINHDCPNILIIALYSSNYRPSKNTKKYFDTFITWDQLSKIYLDSRKIFNRANEIYSNFER